MEPDFDLEADLKQLLQDIRHPEPVVEEERNECCGCDDNDHKSELDSTFISYHFHEPTPLESFDVDPVHDYFDMMDQTQLLNPQRCRLSSDIDGSFAPY